MAFEYLTIEIESDNVAKAVNELKVPRSPEFVTVDTADAGLG